MKISQPTVPYPDGETTALLLLRADKMRQQRSLRALVTAAEPENTVSGSFSLLQEPSLMAPDYASAFQKTIQQILGDQVAQVLRQLDADSVELRQQLRDRGYTKPRHIRDGYRHLINTFGLPLLMGSWATSVEQRSQLFHAMCRNGNPKALAVVEKVIGFSSPTLRPVVLQLRREVLAARRRKQRRQDARVVKKIMSPPATSDAASSDN